MKRRKKNDLEIFRTFLICDLVTRLTTELQATGIVRHDQLSLEKTADKVSFASPKSMLVFSLK